MVMAFLPDVNWLVRAFDTYEEARDYKKAIEARNSQVFNGDSPNFGGPNSLDPDVEVQDGEPDYLIMEVPYAV